MYMKNLKQSQVEKTESRTVTPRGWGREGSLFRGAVSMWGGGRFLETRVVTAVQQRECTQ